jgi:hypothetical protein
MGRPNTIHLLQAQAFIEAAEDIVVDDNVIEDLAVGLDLNDLDTKAGDSELHLDVDDALELDENDGLDDPEYNALMDEGKLLSETSCGIAS